MDQNQEEVDRPWDDLQGVLSKDIVEKFKEIGPNVYSHQYEFIKYCLAQDIKQQNPLIALRSQTGSGKTLCFQALIYSAYLKDVHANFCEIKPLKQRDGTMKDTAIFSPFSVVLGQTVYLKQHEENFRRHLPKRLSDDGLSFQTFFALTKDQQFQVAENKIEETKANVLLCHPSKLMVGIKMRILNFSRLRYLIIDEADQLLDKNPQNATRAEVQNIISFIIGQTANQAYQIIFVSASLEKEDIEEFMRDAIQKNIDADKKVDPRFYRKIDDINMVTADVMLLPAIQKQIAPYTITHMYIDTKNENYDQTLVDLIKTIFDEVSEVSIMIFFNKKADTYKLTQLLKENNKLKFIVEKDLIADCTGDTNQTDREVVRKQFMTGQKKILLCTDVLQRGLDFRRVRVIIHYGLPQTANGEFNLTSYQQRSGRTGRAKDEGVVVSILTKEDASKIPKKEDLPTRKEQMIKKLGEIKSKVKEYQQEEFIKQLETVLEFDKQ